MFLLVQNNTYLLANEYYRRILGKYCVNQHDVFKTFFASCQGNPHSGHKMELLAKMKKAVIYALYHIIFFSLKHLTLLSLKMY